MTNTIQELNNFTIDSIPNLDTVVLGALELFKQHPAPEIQFDQYKRLLVVGSGNAEATGKILFERTAAIFASESNYLEKIKNIDNIDGAVIISASGAKHAPSIVKNIKQMNIPVTLLTNTNNSLASKELDKTGLDREYIFAKNREPYTYNTSTYMGMILGYTKENPEDIENFINQKIASIPLPDFSKYTKYYLIVPPEFSGIIRMLQVKFIELFGRNIARDIETSEYVQHATTVASSEELFISFGYDNQHWGSPDNRLYIPLPSNAGYGAMMAIGYYVIAQIQKSQPQYFKNNIVKYCEEVSKVFNQTINPIVE